MPRGMLPPISYNVMVSFAFLSLYVIRQIVFCYC